LIAMAVNLVDGIAVVNLVDGTRCVGELVVAPATHQA
jgi:hypothetical protein